MSTCIRRSWASWRIFILAVKAAALVPMMLLERRLLTQKNFSSHVFGCWEERALPRRKTSVQESVYFCWTKTSRNVVWVEWGCDSNWGQRGERPLFSLSSIVWPRTAAAAAVELSFLALLCHTGPKRCSPSPPGQNHTG